MQSTSFTCVECQNRLNTHSPLPNRLNELLIKTERRQFECNAAIDMHFADLKTQIRIRRTSLMQQIQRIFEGFEEELEEKRNEFKIVLTQSAEQTDSSSETKIRELESRLQNMESTRVDLNDWNFESHFEFNKSSFGSLNHKDEQKHAVTLFSIGREINVWDLKSSTLLSTFKGDSNRGYCFIIYGNEKIITSNICIKVWDIRTGQRLKMLTGHLDSVLDMKILQNGWLASASSDKTIKIWNIESETCCETLLGHRNWVRCLDQLPGENGCLVSGSYDESIKIWCLSTRLCVKTLKCHSVVLCVKVIDGEMLACGCFDGKIFIWNHRDGICVNVLRGHTEFVRNLEIRRFHNQLISCSYDTTIKIWCIYCGHCTQTLVEHTKPVNSIRLNTKGRLVSGSCDSTIKIWDLNSGICVKTIIDRYPIDFLNLCTLNPLHQE